MDLKLRREAPVFKRCCFCIPLRRGLIAWGYARLILNILVICYAIMIILYLFYFLPMIYVSIYVAVVAYIMVDVAFTGLLVFACHKKNFKLLRISYIYNIVGLIMYVAFGTYALISDITRTYTVWGYYTTHRFLIMELVATCALLFTSMFVQVYVMLLIRSEVIKLQNQSLEMQFVNNATEAEARCVSAERSTEPNTEEKYSAQYAENGHDICVQHGVY